MLIKMFVWKVIFVYTMGPKVFPVSDKLAMLPEKAIAARSGRTRD